MPYCTKCGKKLREGAKFCTQCGNPVKKTSRESFKRTTRINRTPYKPISSVSRSTSYKSSLKPSFSENKDESSRNNTKSYKNPILFYEKDKTPISEVKKHKKLEKLDLSKKEEKATESISRTDILSTMPHDKPNQIPENPPEKILEPSPSISPLLEKSLFIDTNVSPDTDIMANTEKKLLKDQLDRIKYSFKSIQEVNPNQFVTSFLAGSLQQVEWNFTDHIKLVGTLPDTVNKEINFTIDIPSERPEYDWKNPYAIATFQTKIENQNLVRRIKREGRVVEKLSRIKGKVKTEINGNTIILEIDKAIPENIRPSLDSIKELAWLIDITLR